MADARTISLRQVSAVALGNALEFFDFLSYAFFAVYIGRAFFPSADSTASLLASLATFGAGFLTRPIGAIVLGRLGDRIGRKPTMIFSFATMGVAMLGIALTPSYGTIGIAAPILVILFRLIQGFALGGEVGSSTSFLVEAAPVDRRGLYVSLQKVGQDAAFLVAGLIGFGLSSFLTDAELSSWGWRVVFIVGALTVPLGLILRRSLPETLEESDGDAPPVPAKSYLRLAVLATLILAPLSVSTYLLSYLTTYAIQTLQMPATLAFGAPIALGICGILFDPVGGWLSDRIGRKPVMIVPWALLLLTVVPAFYALEHYRTAGALWLLAGALQILTTAAVTSAIVLLTESLPKSVRCGGVAIVYALAVSIFGGSSQFIVTWLMEVTGNALAPAWYLLATGLVGLVAMILVHESLPGKAKLATLQPA